MSIPAELLEGNTLGAQELTALGDQVGRVVMRVKDFTHPADKQGEGRRMSAREIGDLIGVSHSAINNVVSELRESQPDDARPAGRTYTHTLADAITIREAMGRTRKRKKGEPCVVLGDMNFKGGVAKSTTTAHIAQYLALHGWRALVIDCDPQGTLSTLFGIHPDLDLGADDTLVPYFAGREQTLDYCIRQTEIPTLSVIPANVGLAEADLLLPARQRDERARGNPWFYMTALADGIATIEQNYDVILLDCPPSMSYLTTVATQACDALLVPMRPSMPDFASSAQFIRMFGTFQEDVDAVLNREKRYDWIRVLVTLGEKNNTSVEMEEIIRKAYGDLVLAQRFPYMTAIATASKRMRTIYDVNRADVPGRQLASAQAIVDQMCSAVEDLLLKTRTRIAQRKASTTATAGEKAA